jgi:hypothetical protein
MVKFPKQGESGLSFVVIWISAMSRNFAIDFTSSPKFNHRAPPSISNYGLEADIYVSGAIRSVGSLA